MEETTSTAPLQTRRAARLKVRAFSANHRAKASEGQTRAAFYREKAAAINAALEAGYAFVGEIDWWAPDPVFSIEFIGGGKIHTKLSSLDSRALKSVRCQLGGHPQPQKRPISSGTT